MGRSVLNSRDTRREQRKQDVRLTRATRKRSQPCRARPRPLDARLAFRTASLAKTTCPHRTCQASEGAGRTTRTWGQAICIASCGGCGKFNNLLKSLDKPLGEIGGNGVTVAKRVLAQSDQGMIRLAGLALKLAY